MKNLELKVPTFEDIEKELQEFEIEERKRLNIPEAVKDQWMDTNPQEFKRENFNSTTIYIGGLTIAHDQLLQSALQGLGYNVEALDCPDTAALHYGKEFGNRGQCNPTYFTVGNLVKKLIHMRDVEKVPVETIVKKHLFLTAGSCGPCRFGTYVTEYRKALRDAGFDGFRVLLVQQAGGIKQATGDDMGFNPTIPFFVQLFKSIIAGDVINALGYRIRPYEINEGETDKVIQASKEILQNAFVKKKSIVLALRKCRKLFSKIKINPYEPKPKVMIIGEFWAMTTEGDGNYKLQRFLEQEGAEVFVQPITAWIMYLLWERKHDIKNRLDLNQPDQARKGLEGKNGKKMLRQIRLGELIIKSIFKIFANSIGLRNYKLSNMESIEKISKSYYNVELRGGEGHMEVGKLIESVQKKKAHMVISVKPFGCMPSASVSDGVQSTVVNRHPEAIFCPVETTGDGEVNFQSRVLMFLFKARQKARDEFNNVLKSKNVSDINSLKSKHGDTIMGTQYPKHNFAGTASNYVHQL